MKPRGKCGCPFHSRTIAIGLRHPERPNLGSPCLATGPILPPGRSPVPAHAGKTYDRTIQDFEPFDSLEKVDELPAPPPPHSSTKVRRRHRGKRAPSLTPGWKAAHPEGFRRCSEWLMTPRDVGLGSPGRFEPTLTGFLIRESWLMKIPVG
jgi:hypothetical protein